MNFQEVDSVFHVSRNGVAPFLIFLLNIRKFNRFLD